MLRATAHIVEQTPSGPGHKLTGCKVNKLIRLNHEAVYADEDHGVVLVVVPVDASGERMNGHGGGTARELRANDDVLAFANLVSDCWWSVTVLRTRSATGGKRQVRDGT